MRRNRKKNNQKRRGAAVVEFAIVAPVLTMLTLGSIDIGRAIHVAQLVSNASREGARTASRVDVTDENTAIDAAKDYLESAGIDRTSVTVLVKDGNGSSISGGDLTTITSGDPISVEVSASYASCRWLSFLTFLDAAEPSTITIMRRD